MTSHIFEILNGSWLQVYFGSLILLLTIMNPLAMLAIFMNITSECTISERKHISKKACIAVAVLLILVTWFGGPVLKFFGVSFPAFAVAGGILLFLFCLPLVKAVSVDPMKLNAESCKLNEDIAIVPLAIPIISGPATILQVLLCLEFYGSTFYVKLIMSLSSFTSVVILFVFLYFGDFFTRIIGISKLNIIKILVGVILLSISINIIAKGIAQLIAGIH